MQGRFAAGLSRRDFIRAAGAATLATTAGLPLGAMAASGRPRRRYNILFILTDQERHFAPGDHPSGYRLPGHERLASKGVVFENHQVASCVCTPSRSVIYTGQHIQKNGMFDNTNFPWANDLSTDIPTLGDLLRARGYYTAYKGKWHLAAAFETVNDLHAPRRVLSSEMEAYGFSDYMGIGDIIAHTQGGFLHDGVIASMAKSWLRGRATLPEPERQPWFLAVNLVNPHDVMYYNTDPPGKPPRQAATAMMDLNRAPENTQFSRRWNASLPRSRGESLSAPGRPRAHEDFARARGALVGRVPNEDERWRRLNDYYLNCIQNVDGHVVDILDELDDLGLADETIVVYTADHGELGGAHGLSGKGATAFREQLNVPLIVSHPEIPGGKRCRAVTSHLDLAPTLLGLSGDPKRSEEDLRGADFSPLLGDPEAASLEAVRPAALFNYNMLAYLDGDFLTRISEFIRAGGSPEELPGKGWRPDLTRRGAIRTAFDGRYKLSRYFSPKEHHRPASLEALLGNNDVELFDLESDPLEMRNLATDPRRHGELLVAMNEKLNALIDAEVGEDLGQMLPGGTDARWTLDPDVANLRM